MRGTKWTCKDVHVVSNTHQDKFIRSDHSFGGAVNTALAPAVPLTAADRCDRCGAQAYVRVVLPSGADLLFCAHHGREHAEALAKANAEVHDESGRLTETTEVAPLDER